VLQSRWPIAAASRRLLMADRKRTNLALKTGAVIWRQFSALETGAVIWRCVSRAALAASARCALLPL
jgi:hypothetical protein